MRSRKGFWVLVIWTGAFFTTVAVNGQPPPVTLPQIVLTAKHRETVTPPGATTTTRLVAVRSGNTSVATAQAYRNKQVEIVAVAPGNTTVEFFDTARGQKYVQPVWVQAANATGGGGAGYDPGKNQLPQVVMKVKTTYTVTVPGSGQHQLSSVVSSNPSVATARTNTANTIQIYAKALGDTWVDFTDNATRTTYQVHVWVTTTGSKPPGSGSSGSTGSGKPKPQVKASPVAGGRIDPCLVGEWVSVALNRHSGSGGAGVKVTIEKNGRVTIDYSEMQPIGYPHGQTTIIRGIAIVQMSTVMGQLLRNNVGGPVTVIHTPGPTEEKDYLGGLGVPLSEYTCTRNTISNFAQVFKRKAQ